MPTERLSMRRIRHVLQLHFGAHASARVIAREVGVGRSTVQDYLTRAAAAALMIFFCTRVAPKMPSRSVPCR